MRRPSLIGAFCTALVLVGVAVFFGCAPSATIPSPSALPHSSAPATITWRGGASTQVTLTVLVTSTATEWITNSASVAASEPRFSVPVYATVQTLLNPERIYLPVIAQ